MEFTSEEIALINKHREQQAALVAAKEAERQRQAVHKAVADLIEQAKSILIDAKQVAKDNGMEYQIGDMVTNMIEEVSNGSYWYGSDQSLC